MGLVRGVGNMRELENISGRSQIGLKKKLLKEFKEKALVTQLTNEPQSYSLSNFYLAKPETDLLKMKTGFRSPFSHSGSTSSAPTCHYTKWLVNEDLFCALCRLSFIQQTIIFCIDEWTFHCEGGRQWRTWNLNNSTAVESLNFERSRKAPTVHIHLFFEDLS